MSTEIQPNIVEQIRAAYEQSRGFADTAKANAEMAIQSAGLCGRLLITKRDEIEHGNKKGEEGFLSWLRTNCPFISQRTAYNYIGLAEKLQHVAIIEGCQSLRQAYIAAGILPEAEPTPIKPPRTPETRESYLLHLSALDRDFRKLDVNTLNDTAKDVLRAQLEPLVEVYHKLCEAA